MLFFVPRLPFFSLPPKCNGGVIWLNMCWRTICYIFLWLPLRAVGRRICCGLYKFEAWLIVSLFDADIPGWISRWSHPVCLFVESGHRIPCVVAYKSKFPPKFCLFSFCCSFFTFYAKLTMRECVHTAFSCFSPWIVCVSRAWTC